MKKALIFSLGIGFLWILSSAHAVILVGWDLPGSTANTNVAASTAATGVIGGNMSNNVGLTRDTASAARWQFSSYNQTGTDEAALTNALAGNDSVALSLTASNGYSLTIRGVGPFTFYRSGSGPKNIALLYSTSSTFSTYSIVATNATTGTNSTTTDFSANSAWTNFTTPITVAEGTTGYFRIVGYGASGSGGTGGYVASGTVDFSLVGDVNSLSMYTWTGGSGNGAVGTAANWQSGGASAAWVNGKDATFASGGDLAIDAAGVSAGMMALSGATPLNLTGGALTASSITAGAGSALNLNGGAATVSGNVDLTDASIGGGNLSLGGILSANISTGTTTLSTALGGNGSLSKSGAGELILSRTNSYTGTTAVGGGTLTTGAAEILSDTATLQVSANATLKLGGNETVGGLNAIFGSFINLQGNTLTAGGNNSSFTNGATITGTGGLVKNGTGQMYLNNSTNFFSGGFVLNSGEVAFTSSGTASAGVLSNSVFGTGNLTLNGGAIMSSSAASGRTVYNNIYLNGNVQFGNTAWGTTNVQMNGTTSTTATTNTNTGVVTITTSVSYNPLFTASTNSGGATTLLGDSTINTLNQVDWYQPISGNYRITKTGTGVYSLSNNYLILRGSNNIAGMTVNSGMVAYKNRYAFGTGTLVLNDGVCIGQEGTINNTPVTGNDQIDRAIPNDILLNGNVAFGTGATAVHLGGNLNLNGNRTITVANTTYIYGSVSNGALTVFDTSPSRTLHLLASNSYAGGTIHNGGILNVGHDNALGTGGLTVYSNLPYTNISTNVTTTVTGGVTNSVTNVTTNVTVASNRLTITSNRALANDITLASGALYTIETPQIVTSTVDGNGVTNNITNVYSMSQNGVITGGGSILKTGPGTLTLAGGLTYTGSTTVSAGTLQAIKTNLTAAITTTNVVVIFSNGITPGTSQALPGALAGSYPASSISYSNLPAIFKASFDPNAGTVTVANKASQSITGLAPSDAKALGDVAYALSVTKGASTSPLTFSSDNPSVATVSSAGMVTIVGVGSTVIRVNQAGDENYLAATEVTQTLTVNSAGSTPEDAYPGKGLSELAPNGMTYLVNYAFGGNSSNAPKMPSQDVSDPTKLSLVAYVRTNDSGVGGVLSVKGQTNNSLSGWSTNTFGPSSIPADQSDAPAGTQKQIFSVPNTGDRLFLRLKVTK